VNYILLIINYIHTLSLHYFVNYLISHIQTDEPIEGYFQQDNATAYSAPQTIAYLKEFLNTRLVEFPARSPDLAIMKYLFIHASKTQFLEAHATLSKNFVGLLEMFVLT
jgi:hypothetical protein